MKYVPPSELILIQTSRRQYKYKVPCPVCTSDYRCNNKAIAIRGMQIHLLREHHVSTKYELRKLLCTQ